MSHTVGPLFLHRPRKGLQPPPSWMNRLEAASPVIVVEPLPEGALPIYDKVPDVVSVVSEIEPTPEPVVVEPIPEPVVVEPTPEPVVVEPIPEPEKPTVVVEPTPEPEKPTVVVEPTPEKPKVSMLSSKAEILQAAADAGLKADASMTKRQLLALFEIV